MWYGTFDKVDFVLILVLSLGYIWMTWCFEHLGQRNDVLCSHGRGYVDTGNPGLVT